MNYNSKYSVEMFVVNFTLSVVDDSHKTFNYSCIVICNLIFFDAV